MTLDVQIHGQLEKPNPIRLTTTNSTTIVTGFDNTRMVARFSLANETGSGVLVTCHYDDGTAEHLIWSTTIAANGAEIVEMPVRLYENDEFKVTAASANAITVKADIISNDPSVGSLASNTTDFMAEH